MLGFFRAAVAGLRAQQVQMDIIGSNLSNVNTPGFRRARSEFADYLYQAVQPVPHQPAMARQIGTGVGIAATTTLFDPGPVQQTDNPLDLAIDGDGFFQVQLPNGQIGYTRDGQFHVDASGRVVTADGLPLGPEIVVPAGAERTQVEADGTVVVWLSDSEIGQAVGRLELATFVNPSGLQPIGGGRFLATDAAGSVNIGTPGAPGTGTLMSGTVEGSNVELADEMANLVLAQRAYGFSASILQTIDEMIGMAANLRR